MGGTFRTLKFQKISPGTIRAVVFLLLVVIILAFWLYTQLIFNHVRDFQKSVVKNQVQIYLSVIDPSSNYDNDLSSALVESVVLDASYPSIYTDMELNPIQGLWHGIKIDSKDTTSVSRDKLIKLIDKMDKTNPPEHISMPGLKARTDTLTVLEIPLTLKVPLIFADQSNNLLPLIVTDQSSNLLFSRNIPASALEYDEIQKTISSLDVQSPPIKFDKENEPTLIFHGLLNDERWPMIIIKNGTKPIYWRDIVVSLRDTTETGELRLTDNINYLARNGIAYNIITNNVPIENDWLYHYGDLPFLTLIGWLPVIELAVILVLLTIAFIGLINIKNAEQQSIWVGMAKETAHQLGTPISSLSGWLELLKIDSSKDMIDQAIPDMDYDVNRLTRVAARFSNVGSKPELKPIVVSDVIDEVLDYYRARLPRMGKSVVIEGHYKGIYQINGNTELLNWSFENLVKNSLFAIESDDGKIVVNGSMSKNFREVIFDFTDNGKGIASSNHNKVMKPGYTTRKRGWGLGLSLVKRIIEDYHGGKIFILDSKPGTGTTFRIILPASEPGPDTMV